MGSNGYKATGTAQLKGTRVLARKHTLTDYQ
jgi:hypothetical protein